MSFYGTMSDNKAIVAAVEVSENTHSSSGSRILMGHDHPGGATNHDDKAANQTLMPGRLRAGIDKPRTRTDKLERKYASTGTSGDKGLAVKG